jgi:hypothetical protein
VTFEERSLKEHSLASYLKKILPVLDGIKKRVNKVLFLYGTDDNTLLGLVVAFVVIFITLLRRRGRV